MHLNLLDTPGLLDFANDSLGSLAAVEGCLVLVSCGDQVLAAAGVRLEESLLGSNLHVEGLGSPLLGDRLIELAFVSEGVLVILPKLLLSNVVHFA